MKEIQGDLIELAQEGCFDVIIHGCNCFCSMGAGIAKNMREVFPAAMKADLLTEKGDKEKLGTYSRAVVYQHFQPLTIINAYTQYHYNGTSPLVNYDAVETVFKKIKQDYTGKKIGYPKIGAGLAGGDWEVLRKIIDQALEGEDHTCVTYQVQVAEKGNA